MEKVIDIRNLKTVFRNQDKNGTDVTVIDGVSIYIKPGEIIGLVGESGSGKSITMMSTVQLLPTAGEVASGEVILEENGKNILEYPKNGKKMQQIRGGDIGFIFQEPMSSLNPVITVGEQIKENILLHTDLDKEQAKAKALEMMKIVGIPDPELRYGYYSQQFSGGMRQRIMIAMVLAAEPKIIIADEATTALDATTQAQILERIRDLAKKKGISVVIVTHNLGVVARYAERIYVMYSGNIVETADAKKLFRNPQHPYSRGLLRTIPRMDDPKDRVLIPIEGLPPSPKNRPSYCPFYDRCIYRMDKCKEQPKPTLQEVKKEHFCACWLTDEEKEAKRLEIESREVATAPQKTISEEISLEVKGVSKYFPVYAGAMKRKIGTLHAVDDISFNVRKGETLGIVGDSRCGKTTLARCIMRIYEPDAGEIMFYGKDIAHLGKKEMKPIHPRIAMVFQDPVSSLDPRQSVGSIVGENLKVHNLVNSKEEYDKRVDELFSLVDLDPSLRDRFPHEFSGGQRQRVGVARALSSNPEILICDEPISALDVSIQAQIINLLEKIQADLGITYIFIAHDLAVVKHISDRVLVMYLGRVMEIAECDELYNNPLHPYTQALISAVPIADPELEEQREYIPLKGEAPSGLHVPEGCPFSDRCPKAMERCHKEVPPMKMVSPNHGVYCFLY